MEFFLGFAFLAVICSLGLRKQRQETMLVTMFLLSAAVVFGYFFLNQI